MAVQVAAQKQPNVGPLLVQLMKGIDKNTGNDAIIAWSQLVIQGLAGMGITSTKWVTEMAFQFRGIQCGVTSDWDLYRSRAWSALSLLHAIDHASYNQLIAMAERHRKGPVRRNGEKSSTETQEKKDVATPGLDRAIDMLDLMTKGPLPDGIKGALNGLKSSLELERATTKGEPAPKQALELAEAMFEVMKALVPAAAQDPELAAQAASQLGKIAKVIGYAGKAIGVIEGVYKIVTGKSFGGKVLTKGEKIEAAIDVICSVTGTVGLAAGISLGAFKWIFNNIGVPVKEATEIAGLKNFFGKTPEQMIEAIDALPTEPAKARWTMRKLRLNTFRPVKDLFSQTVLSDAWEKYFTANMQGETPMMNQINEAAKHKVRAGDDPQMDQLLTKLAEAHKSVAKQFVWKITNEARNWKRE